MTVEDFLLHHPDIFKRNLTSHVSHVEWLHKKKVFSHLCLEFRIRVFCHPWPKYRRDL